MLAQAFRTMRFHQVLKRVSQPWMWFTENKITHKYARSAEHLLRYLSTDLRTHIHPTTHVVKLLRTRSDVVVILLAEDDTQRSSKVLKLPLTLAAVQSTDAHRSVLTSLHATPALESLADIMPQPLDRGTYEAQPYYLETALPGVDAGGLIRANRLPQTFLVDAARVICRLHLATGVWQTVDDIVFAQLVGNNIMLLRQKASRWSNHQQVLPKLSALENELHNKLIGIRLLFSWVHGDYWPGNILVQPESGCVSGIVDWDRASPNTLSFLDVLHLVAYSHKMQRHISLGEALVTHLLPAAYSAQERAVLSEVLERLDLPTDASFLRSVVFVYWLQFVAANIQRYPAFEQDREWMRDNVFIVLEQSL